MKILITGANGFLGSNTLRAALKAQHQVFAISQNNNNIQDLTDRITFRQNVSDDYYNLKEEIINFSPDVIMHFAWWGGNSYADTNSVDQYNKNIPLVISLLEIAKECVFRPKFVGVGSFAEYGILSTKAKEDQLELPNSNYGLSKNIVKNISKLFCEQHSMEWSWIRPCFVYGPGDVKTRLIPKTIIKLKTEKNIELNSSTSIIDYIYIDDFSEASLMIAENTTNGIFNICSGNEYTAKFIVKIIANTLNNNSQLVFNAKLDRENFPKYICGSNEKLNSLGWKPKTSINEGLLKTINWYSENMNTYSRK